MSTASQSPFVSMEHLSDHFLEDVYKAAVDSIEEAILNAMIAAETMTFIKPAGFQAKAIDHGRLLRILSEYNRLS